MPTKETIQYYLKSNGLEKGEYSDKKTVDRVVLDKILLSFAEASQGRELEGNGITHQQAVLQANGSWAKLQGLLSNPKSEYAQALKDYDPELYKAALNANRDVARVMNVRSQVRNAFIENGELSITTDNFLGLLYPDSETNKANGYQSIPKTNYSYHGMGYGTYRTSYETITTSMLHDALDKFEDKNSKTFYTSSHNGKPVKYTGMDKFYQDLGDSHKVVKQGFEMYGDFLDEMVKKAPNMPASNLAPYWDNYLTTGKVDPKGILDDINKDKKTSLNDKAKGLVSSLNQDDLPSFAKNNKNTPENDKDVISKASSILKEFNQESSTSNNKNYAALAKQQGKDEGRSA